MEFTKMHGLGNDFIIFEDNNEPKDWSSIALRLCERRLSVGADGILLVLPSDKADIKMRVINADGSEAEMCGNGIRCFAKYVYENGIVSKTDMTVETLAGIIRPKLNMENGKISDVSVDMGLPVFGRAGIPMTGKGSAFNVQIKAGGKKVVVNSLLMNVPHTVVITDCLEDKDIGTLGPAIEKHEIYPQKTNVNFVRVLDKENIRVRTWERGAGFTLACGTGACASVVTTHKKDLTGRKVTVHLPAGKMVIEIMKDGRVIMTGPAKRVYKAVLT